MDKGRVAAFTDAVVAIIMTIMILEFKTPETFEWDGLLEQLPYLFAFAVSFLFISVAWYNHHYMFAVAPKITKKIFWLNSAWLFSMSLIPVATAWAGKFIDKPIPEYFYVIVFFIWSVAYLGLTLGIVKAAKESGNEEAADKISAMTIFRYLNSWLSYVVYVIVLVAIYFYPPTGMLITFIELVVMAFKTTEDSDQVA